MFFPPEDPEAAARFWRDRTTKLEAEVAELKAAARSAMQILAARPMIAVPVAMQAAGCLPAGLPQ
jgi:hypothetical protein